MSQTRGNFHAERPILTSFCPELHKIICRAFSLQVVVRVGRGVYVTTTAPQEVVKINNRSTRGIWTTEEVPDVLVYTSLVRKAGTFITSVIPVELSSMREVFSSDVAELIEAQQKRQKGPGIRIPSALRTQWHVGDICSMLEDADPQVFVCEEQDDVYAIVTDADHQPLVEEKWKEFLDYAMASSYPPLEFPLQGSCRIVLKDGGLVDKVLLEHEFVSVALDVRRIKDNPMTTLYKILHGHPLAGVVAVELKGWSDSAVLHFDTKAHAEDGLNFLQGLQLDAKPNRILTYSEGQLRGRMIIRVPIFDFDPESTNCNVVPLDDGEVRPLVDAFNQCFPF